MEPEGTAADLTIGGCRAAELVERFGAPLWVIDEDRIRTNVRTLRSAFRDAYPRTEVAYASKANPEPAIVAIVRDEGALVDAVTLGHLRLIERAGVPPSDVVFNGNAKTVDELACALRHRVRAINVDSLEELEAIASLQPFDAPPVAICLRVATDPERHAADDREFADEERGSKFGIAERDVVHAANNAAEHPGLELAGVHNHVGFTAYGTPFRRDLELRRHRRAAEQTLDVAATLREHGHPIRIVNLGGGYRVPRPHPYGPGGITDIPTIEEYADAVAGTVARGVREHDLGDAQLILEAGGYLVSDAVTLLARVLRRKAALDGGDDWAFVENTSAYHFVRRLMFGFEHHVALAHGEGGPLERVRIAGPVCTDDTVADHVLLPRLREGDLLGVLDQGAYCEAVTSDYCAIPIPASIVVSNGRAALAGRRETLEDLVARFEVPDWIATPV
jgi:diaminopimelate decarboxylase